MRKLFKKAILGVSALALPLALAATVNATGPSDAEVIDTKLEYQLNTSANSMRFISTMELNGKSLDDITSIDMNFRLTKGDQVKDSIPQSTTTVYESISGENGKEKIDGTYYAVFTITNIDSKVGWRITPTFTYNFADGSEADVIASSWLIGGKRQYFVQQYTDWGTDLYYYMFKSETEHNADFPGERMNVYDADNHIYYFDYLPSEEYTSIIFSNGDYEGHSQTATMPVSSTNNYYLQQDENAFAHPTLEHDVTMQHNDNQHWKHCSICGDDFDYESHNLSGSTTGTTRTISCSECGYSVSFDLNTVYFTNTEGWSTVKVHRWGGAGTAIDWPGVDATKVGVNEFNQDIYAIDVTGYEQIIFHNNSGWQTVNIVLADLGDYNAVYLDKGNNDHEGHTYINKFLYIPEHHQE